MKKINSTYNVEVAIFYTLLGFITAFDIVVQQWANLAYHLCLFGLILTYAMAKDRAIKALSLSYIVACTLLDIYYLMQHRRDFAVCQFYRGPEILIFIMLYVSRMFPTKLGAALISIGLIGVFFVGYSFLDNNNWQNRTEIVRTTVFDTKIHTDTFYTALDSANIQLSYNAVLIEGGAILLGTKEILSIHRIK